MKSSCESVKKINNQAVKWAKVRRRHFIDKRMKMTSEQMKYTQSWVIKELQVKIKIYFIFINLAKFVTVLP